MTWASTCPAAITGLLAALGRSAALSGVKVADGRGITDPDADEVISVGFTGADGEAAADAALAAEGAGGDPSREQYAIRCAIGVTSGDEGDDGIAAARTRAFALLGAVGAAIVADRKLGGAVMSARVSSWSLGQAQVSGGVSVALRFEVSVDAYVQR